MNSDRELLQQALDALELHAKQYPHMVKGYLLDAAQAIRARLAQEERSDDEQPEERSSDIEQEPVAWQNPHNLNELIEHDQLDPMWQFMMRPLYTAPQPVAQPVLCKSEVKRLAIQMGLFNEQPVLPLTDEQIGIIAVDLMGTFHVDDNMFARALEAAHGIK